MSTALLAIALVALYLAYNGWRPLNDRGTRPIWILALITAELVPQHVLANALIGTSVLAWGRPLDGVEWVTLGATATSLALLLATQAKAHRTRAVLAAAIPGWAPQPLRRSNLLRPIPPTPDDMRRRSDISYGSEPQQLLDIVTPDGGATSAPVLVVVPGGSWTSADRHRQGRSLIHRMVGVGWVAVVVGYRTSPHVAFPAHLDDVRAALAWVRAHATEFGGDPDRLVLAGGSAGGHLALLSTLGGAEGVIGCMPFYPVTDLFGSHGGPKWPFLVTSVLQSTPESDPKTWNEGSPVRVVNGGDHPPMHFWHGAADSLVHPEESRRMVAELRAAGVDAELVELPGATHGFDVISSVRTHWVVEGAAAILERWLERAEGPGEVKTA